MDRISTFNLSADLAGLQTALAQGQLPGPLNEPMQALVTRITEAASESPVAVYLFSTDEHAGLRDHFAFLLARTLTQHVPSTLLVDCDFLDVGLHGFVPEPDALGFLDLLLYGSSLGVITQESAGVKTIGAGSFPVTKKMPFVIGAFEEAARRLVAHARCVVFVGPIYEDHGEPHPLIGAVDLPVLVRELDHAYTDAIDPVEENIASRWDVELASVRMVSPSAARPADRTFSSVLGDEDDEAAPVLTAQDVPAPHVDRDFVDLADTAEDDGDAAAPPPPPAPPARPPVPPESGPSPVDPITGAARPDGQRRRRRVNPFAVVIAVVAVALAAWWISSRRGDQTPAGVATGTTQPASEAPPETTATRPPASGQGQEVAARDTAAAPAPRTEPVVEEVVEEPEYVDPADTFGRSGGVVHISSHDIHVMEDLERNWPDHYFIHISSFRRSVEARNEVAYLESREFPVFIVFLDLGAKGKWYRVYAGPFTTREEARELKKSLDDIPRVRFTRITKISG